MEKLEKELKLIEGIEKEDIALIHSFKPQDLVSIDWRKTLPHHKAAKKGNKKIFQLLLNNIPDDILHIKSKSGKTVLHEACSSRKKDIVHLLLDRKFPVDQEDQYGDTPLHKVTQAVNKSKIIVDSLLQAGADPNKKNQVGCSPFYYACEASNSLDLVSMFLDHGAEVNQQNNDGITPLHCACKRGNKEIISLLLSKKADLNQKNNMGDTPLYYACKRGDGEIVSMLMSLGADIFDQNKNEDTPLHYACENGHKGVVSQLLSAQAKINAQNKRSESPLHKACERPNNKEVVSELLSFNPKLDEKARPKGTPLSIACQGGDIEVVSLLLSAGADIENKENGHTPLHTASQRGHKEIVSLLIQHGANIHAQTDFKTTPLHMACRANIETVKILLQAKADIHMKDTIGQTALSGACDSHQPEIVSLLLSEKADVNVQRSDTGSTPLHSVCMDGDEVVASVLIQSESININIQNEAGLTPLHWAWRYNRPHVKQKCNGHEEIVSMLLAANADVTIPDKDGNTPLHFSFAGGGIDVVSLLFTNANFDIKNNSGVTPRHEARKIQRFHKIVELITGFDEENRQFFRACREGDGATMNSFFKQNLEPHVRRMGFFVVCTFHSKSHETLDDVLANFYEGSPLFLSEKDENGWNLFHYAVSYSVVKIASYLVEKGVSFLEKNKNGKSPLDFANDYGGKKNEYFRDFFDKFVTRNELFSPLRAYQTHFLQTINLSSLPPFPHLPSFLSWLHVGVLKSCSLRVEKGGVDEWVLQKYKESRHPSKSRIALIIQFSKVYRGCDQYQFLPPPSENQQNILDLRGFPLTTEFFQLLKCSKYVPFRSLHSIDLRETDCHVSAADPLVFDEAPLITNRFHFDLGFLGFCCEETLSSLHLPLDAMASSLSMTFPLSRPHIKHIIQLARQANKITSSFSSSPKLSLNLDDLFNETVKGAEGGGEEVGWWVLESMLDWGNVRELILGGGRWAQSVIYPFFGRLGVDCVVKMRKGGSFIGVEWVGERTEEEGGVVVLGRTEKQVIRVAGRLKTHFPLVNLTDLDLRPEEIPFLQPLHPRLLVSSQKEILPQNQQLLTVWQRVQSIVIGHNPLLSSPSSIPLLMMCSSKYLFSFKTPNSNLFDLRSKWEKSGKRSLEKDFLDLSSQNLNTSDLQGHSGWTYLEDITKIDLSDNHLSHYPPFLRLCNPNGLRLIHMKGNLLSKAQEKLKLCSPSTIIRLYRAMYDTYPVVNLTPIQDIFVDSIGQIFPPQEVYNSLHLIQEDREYWGGITHLRINPNLETIPLFLGLTESLSIENMAEIFQQFREIFSGYSNLEVSSQLRSLLVYLSFFSAEDEKGILNLSGRNLVGYVANKLPLNLLEQEDKEKITKVDLSLNPDLNVLPAGLWEMTSLNDIECDVGQFVGLERKYLEEAKKTKDFKKMLAYLELVQIGGILPMNEIKLMLVGESHAGKTCLTKYFQNRFLPKNNLLKREMTDGIDFVDVRFSEKSEIVFHLGDFGGQKVFHYTHQIFYQNHAMYLVIFDLNRPLYKNKREVKSWISAIQSRIIHNKESEGEEEELCFCIYLVGTQVDRLGGGVGEGRRLCEEVRKEAQNCFPEMPISDEIFCVSVVSEVGISDLVGVLEKDAPDYLLSVPSVLSQVTETCLSLPPSPLPEEEKSIPFLPFSFFEESLAQLSQQLSLPFISQNKTILLISDSLEKLGKVVVLKSHIPNSSPDGLFISPQWVSHLFSTIVTPTRRGMVFGGILACSSIPKIWREENGFPCSWHRTLLSILEQLDILIPYTDSSFLVPCLLPDSLPSLNTFWRRGSHFLQREIWLPNSGLEAGFMPKIICRVASNRQFQMDKLWKQGLKKWSYLKTQTMRKLLSIIDSIFTSYYSVSYYTTIPCPSSSPSNCYFLFSQNNGERMESDVEEAFSTGQFYRACHPNQKHYHSFHQLCPDAFFQDLQLKEGNFIIDLDKDIDWRNKQHLGTGGFGEVTLAEMKIKEKDGQITTRKVAIKVEKPNKEQESLEDDFQAFGKEVWFMSALKHPNIVQVLAISLSPRRALVMEVLSGGTLYNFLNDPLCGIQKLGEDLLKETTVEGITIVGNQIIEKFESSKYFASYWLESFTSSLSSLKEEFTAKNYEKFKLAWNGLERFYQDSVDAMSGMSGTNFWPFRLKMMLDIANGMKHMHTCDPLLIHRDLKTPNIFLSLKLSDLPPFSSYIFSINPFDLPSVCAIADFGLSTFLYDQTLRVPFNSPLATINPTWAAPEILERKPYNEKVDVYAMGLILLEIFERKHPFIAFSFAEGKLRRAVIEGVRPEIPKDCPSLLRKLIQSCWVADFSKRPSFGVIVEKLEQITEELVPDLFQKPAPSIPLPSPPSNSIASAADSIPSNSPSSCFFSVSLSPTSPSAPSKSPSLSCDFCLKSHLNFFGVKQCQNCLKNFCSRYSSFSSHPSSSSSSSSSTLCVLCGILEKENEKMKKKEEILAEQGRTKREFIEVLCEGGGKLWYGMRKGSMGVFLKERIQERGGRRREKIRKIEAFGGDSHNAPVRSLIFQRWGVEENGVYGGGGRMWSGCDKGRLVVWEGGPVSVRGGVELSVFAGMFQGKRGRRKGRVEEQGVVWITVEEGHLSWNLNPDYAPPSTSISLLYKFADPTCGFPHLTSLHFSEKKIFLFFGEGEWIELEEKEKEEEGGRRNGKGKILYRLIRRIFLSSLLCIFSSSLPPSSLPSSSGILSQTPNHLFPLSSTKTNAGIVVMKEIEGNIWTSLSDLTLCEWYLDDVSMRNGKWFFSPTISPLRSFSFGSSKSLVFAMTSIGQQTWLCCKDKLYSFPSRDFQEAGLTKKSEEDLALVWRETTLINGVSSFPPLMRVVSLFVLVSKGEKELFSFFPESFPPEQHEQVQPTINKQWIVAVGEEGKIWVWELYKDLKIREGEENIKREPILVFDFIEERGEFGSKKENFLAAKSICVDVNEFWIGDTRGENLYNVSLYYFGNQCSPFLIVEEVNFGAKCEGVHAFQVVGQELWVASLNKDVKDGLFLHCYSKFYGRGKSMEGKIYHPIFKSFE